MVVLEFALFQTPCISMSRTFVSVTTAAVNNVYTVGSSCNHVSYFSAQQLTSTGFCRLRTILSKTEFGG